MPWATLLPLLVLLPFSLSGAVRFQTGWTFGASLAVSGALFALLVAGVAFRGLPRIALAEGDLAAPLTLGLALLSVWFTYRLFWDPLFDGLPNTFHGVDIGNHLLLYQRFLNFDHKQYEGFVGLYALMHWYRELFARAESNASSIYLALRFSTYAFLLALPVALAAQVYPIIGRYRDPRRESRVAFACMVVMMFVLATLIFPTVGYFQAEGFYSQIAGLYPMLFAWLFYGLLEEGSSRFIACCGWLVIQRFVYGLNLGDTLLALAYLWAWDARTIRVRWIRWGAWAFVPVACAAAYLIFEKLWPLRWMQGYFIDHSVVWILTSQLLMSMMLLAASGVLAAVQIDVSDACKRLWRYAGVNGMINGTLTAVYFAYDEPLKYYILKYSMYAMLLVTLATVGPLSVLAAHVLTSERRWALRPEHARILLGAALLTAMVGFGVTHGYAEYQAPSVERAERTVPSRSLYSAYEPEIEHFIDRTLQARGRPFGGYYDYYWPRMFTHNGLFFLFAQVPDYHYNGAFNASQSMFAELPGRCYFMLGEPERYHSPASSPMGEQLRKLHAARETCSTFRPPWALEDVRICASCLDVGQDKFPAR